MVMKKSADFIHTFGSLHAGPQDIMISFDVVSFFIRVPVREARSLLHCHFEEDILRLLHHVLTSYFSFTGQFTNKLTA
jgi:hypothetical protein